MATPAQQALRTSKKQLRKATASILSSLSAQEVAAQSAAVTQKVLSQPFFAKSKRISCYLSMSGGGEVDTTALTRGILGAGKILFVPKITKPVALTGSTPPPAHMRMLRVYSEDDLASLPAGVWGIREPEYTWGPDEARKAREDVAVEDGEGVDLILVPGVAFDRSLSRLGHGKGYYDRFLTSYIASGKTKPTLVALALNEQLVSEVPVSEHDWKMDWIITADQVLHRT